ncbi:unnamed protein product [Bursaphelenchus xylophilus]|uniref:(pine wood nematode) hypothetical protein n=1 Tax=Bursaphelenchus xylophilus TaxID=6326 RepID=A0A1I7RQV5_BURXY|nr:unnamed protein product [Bursaphelenchus xylophilus]CAG9130695.1 unnamed protein product [Bursaphelenchus xylophilus]
MCSIGREIVYLLVWMVILVIGGKPHSHPMQEHDPNAEFICKGRLGEIAACICNETAEEVACVNAQFVDIHVFEYINSPYPSVKRVTFHGNNFQDLPDSPLFGSYIHDDLRVLNISANYIVNLNSNALKGAPNIRILDLSNNEIVLKKENVLFLTHTPKLTHLHLRRAFTASVNRTIQFALMMEMFEKANLKNLKFLDLSYNYLTSVPYNLACPFPSLTFLDFKQNLLKTLEMNVTCLSKVDNIDLSRNHFRSLDEGFRRNFANYLPPQSLMLRNFFDCNCKSIDYLIWLRSTHTVREKNQLTCQRASPPNFVGAKLVEVPLNKLDCEHEINETNLGLQISTIFGLIAAVHLLLY